MTRCNNEYICYFHKFLRLLYLVSAVLKKYTQQNICKHAHSDQPIHDHIIYEVIVVPYNLRGNSCTLYHDNKKRKICLEIIVPYACT